MILRIEGNRAILNARATPSLLAILPQLEGRRSWLKAGGLVVENTPRNIAVLSALPGVTVQRKAEEASPAPLRAGAAYKPKTAPHKHQIRAGDKMRGRKVFALLMEQGTGKTKVSIDWCGEMYAAGVITGVLVFSKKGVHRQWIESELPDHCGAPWHGSYWPVKVLPNEMRPGKGLSWFAMNWDAIKTPAGMNMAKEFCEAHNGRLVIIGDESQEIKNPSSQRWKAAANLIKYSAARAILTGTPIAKDLTDEWSQFKWLDESIIGIRYKSTFHTEYCIMGGYENRAVVGHRNLERFQELVEPHSFRITKDEIGILPKQYDRWKFDLLPAQRDMIRDLKTDLETVTAGGQVISAANAAVLLTKIQQVASGFLLDENGERHLIMPIDKNPRVNAALEWLDKAPGEKAVVWCRFRKDIEILREAFKNAGLSVAEYYGDTKDIDREIAKTSFLDRKGKQIFLANPQSAGTGLNLQGLCNRVLYYTNSFAFLDRSQSEDRTHRIGTKGIVTYTDLQAKGSVDAYITANLRKKKGLSQLVLGDLQQMFGELI